MFPSPFDGFDEKYKDHQCFNSSSWGEHEWVYQIYDNWSNNCWDISSEITDINHMLVLEEKSGDHQSHKD